MPYLHSTLAEVLADRYTQNAARVRELAAPLNNTQFWQKPFRSETALATWCCI